MRKYVVAVVIILIILMVLALRTVMTLPGY